MNSILNFETLLPVALVLLLSYFILFITIFTLRRTHIIKAPYAGMEYSQVIIAAAVIIGAFLVAISCIPPLFQSFKTYQAQRTNLYQNTIAKFAQFFLVVLFFEIIYLLVTYLNTKLFFGKNQTVRKWKRGICLYRLCGRPPPLALP